MKKFLAILLFIASFALDGFSVPNFQGAGSAVSGTGSATPTWPAHQTNDVALLFVESRGNQAVSLSVPAGFTQVSGSPQTTTTGSGGTRLSVFWCRATSSNMSNPTIADPGNHVTAQILTYRNVITTGNPWDVTGGGIKSIASTSLSLASITTTVANTLIVQGASKDLDSTAAGFSNQTNANLINVAERTDFGTNAGNGGGIAVWDGSKLTAGAIGTTTVTVSYSQNAYLTIALKPTNSPPIITSPNSGNSYSANVAENTTDVASVVATDPDGQTITYTLSGTDASKFSITSGGVISFVTPPDFEAPTDNGGNNVYDFTVTASDGTLTDTQTFSITVTDMNENPLSDYRLDECKWIGATGEVKDNSANGYNGIAISSLTTNDSGKINRSTTFNGLTHYISIPQNSTNSLRSTGSLVFWIKTTQVGNATNWLAPGISGIEESGGQNDIFWGWIDNNGKIALSAKSDSNHAKSTTSINNGAWHHIVLTRDSVTGALQTYVDGILEGTATGGVGAVTNNFTNIGRIEDTGGTPEYFSGSLDEIKIFDHVLSTQEIQNIYNNELSGKNYDGTTRSPVICDTPPTLTIAPQSYNEGNITNTIDFPITVTGYAGSSTYYVDVNTSDLTAISSSDYNATNQRISITGNGTVNIPITLYGDTTYDQNKTFSVTLSNASTGVTLSGSPATITILNDDPMPTLSISDLNISEGNSTAPLTNLAITLSDISNVDTNVTVTASDYSAFNGIDYISPLTQVVTIPAGQTSVNIPGISIIGDTNYSPDKEFLITLSDPINAILGDENATVTIINDDDAPTLSIPEIFSISEGGTGTKLATITVSLSGTSSQTITADFTTLDGFATATGNLSSGGQDYIMQSGTVTFLPGETTKEITITINGDMLYEPDENLSIQLSNIQNAKSGNLTNTLTIINDDSIPVLSINSVSQSEGNTSTTSFVFTVSASGGSAQPFTFSYSTRDGTAKSYPYAPDSFGTTKPYALLYNPGKQDYNTTNGVISFAPGETTKTITVNVIGNTIFEPNKIFYVDIVSANGADINPLAKSGTGTILNDDTSFAGPNVRDFKPVYSNTFNGNVRVFGNTIVVKNGTGCTTGTQTNCDPGTANNNSVDVKFAQIDTSAGAPLTNSSAELSTTFVPAGSTIKWAGLYWQGYLCGDEKNTPSKKSNAINVKLKRPGDTSYQTLQADLFNWVYLANNGNCNTGTERWYYQGSKDITNIINKTSPQGNYYVGEIISQTGTPVGGSFGGWSIAVVYENTATESVKNVVVYDGYMAIAANADLDQKGVLSSFSTNLEGFITPRKAPIASTFLWFGGEGDLGSTGDAITLTKSDNSAVSLYNSKNPANNIANSAITYKDTYVTNRSPNWQNTIGLDIDDFDISSILSPCQSQTKATLTSTGDGYFPGMFAFSTEVAQGTACYNEGAVFNFVSTGKVTDGKDDNSPAYENALYTQIANQGTSSIDLIAKREYKPNGLISDTETMLSTPGYKGIVHIDFVQPTPTACDQKISLGTDYNIAFAQGYTNRLPVAVNFPQIDTNLSARVRYLVNDSGFAEPWSCDTMSTGCILDYLVNKRGATVCLDECNATKGATLSGCQTCIFDPAKTITVAYPSDPNAAIPSTITDTTKLTRVACSKDSFAVRPDRFTITSSKSLLYPGDTFTLTITAVDAVGNTMTNYAPTYNTTNFTTTVSGGTIGSFTGFTNGIATVSITAGATVGNFTFTIAEKTPKEYAIIDANDGSGSSRFISNGTYIFTVSPILSNLNLMMDECAWSHGVVGSVKDSSGKGLHGTPYYANTTASTGNFKSYRSGDFTTANNAKVEIDDNVLLRPNNLTAMLWLKPSGNQSSYTGVMMKGSTGNYQSTSKSWSDGYGFYINNSSKLCFYVSKSATASVCSTTSIASGTWMHAAATYDGETIKLYINGNTTPQATKTYSSSTNLIDLSTGKLYISSTPQATGQFFKGYIDEVHLMDRTLLPSQIAGIYSNENNGNDLNGVSKPNASCNYTVNLSLSKTPNGLNLLPGDSATFTLSATNLASSGGTADNLTIYDTVPSVLTITSVSSGCSVSGQTVTCSTPSLIKDNSVSYSVNTAVNSAAASGTYTNTANVLSTQTNIGTTSSSVNFTILNNPKFDAFDTANFGNKKLYTRAVGKTATIPIYSLNQAATAIQPYSASLVGVRVVDASSCPNGGSSAWIDVNLSTGLNSFSYTPSKAVKNQKIQFATKNSGYSDATCSSDTFAVRPSQFSISSSSIRAGEELNATVLNGGLGYNGNAVVHTALNSSKPDCATQTNFLLDNELITLLNFNADRNINPMVAKDIGAIDLTLSDTTWTLEDKGNGDCDGTVTDDTISNGKAGCDIITSLPLAINPYQLTTTVTNFSPTWLYLDSSRTQHVSVNTNITSYDKLGNITKNFSDECFGSTVPLGFYFTSTGTLPTDVNLSLTSTTGSQNTILETSTHYGTVFNTPYFMVSNNSFKNGESALSLQFNFLRSYSTPINPFTLTLTDVKTNDATVLFNNDAVSLNHPATFVYGRARAYDVTTNETSAPNPVEIEIYSTTSSGFVGGMHQNVLHWYRNYYHDSIAEGRVIQGGFAPGTSSSNVDTSISPADGLQNVSVTSSTDQSVHLDISPWLWYSPKYSYDYSGDCTRHPCFRYDYTDATSSVQGVNSGTFQGSDFQMAPAKNITNKGVKLFR